MQVGVGEEGKWGGGDNLCDEGINSIFGSIICLCVCIVVIYY